MKGLKKGLHKNQVVLFDKHGFSQNHSALIKGGE